MIEVLGFDAATLLSFFGTVFIAVYYIGLPLRKGNLKVSDIYAGLASLMVLMMVVAGFHTHMALNDSLSGEEVLAVIVAMLVFLWPTTFFYSFFAVRREKYRVLESLQYESEEEQKEGESLE